MKLLVPVLLCLLLCVSSFGQSTSVTLGVTDAGSQAWANGTYEFQLVPAPQYPNLGSYTWTGGTLHQSIPGSLNGSGAATVSVPSSTAIAPTGSRWQVKVCPAATAECYVSAPATVTGGTQTINLTPPVIAITLLNPPGPFTAAYSDSEIVSTTIGGSYFNLTSSKTRTCTAVSASTCTTWADAGGSVSGVSAVTATSPVASSGGSTPDISCPTCAKAAGTATSGQLIVGAGGKDLQTGDLSGDVSTSGSTATTLSSVASAGACGDSTHTCTTTIDAKGRVLSQSPNAIAASGVTSFNTRTGAVTLLSADIPNNSANTSGNAGTATALAANPTNCSAGNYPLGIDASGNVENCTSAAPSSLSWSTLTSGANTNSGNFSMSQNGDYSGTTQQDPNLWLVNGGGTACSPSNIWTSGGVNTNNKTTDGFTACLNGPTSGTANAFSVAVAGLIQINDTGTGGPNGNAGGVGVNGAGFCNVGSHCHVWGGDFAAADKSGSAGASLIGVEVDNFVTNNSATGFGYLAAFQGNGQPTSDNMPAFAINKNSGTGRFTSGYECQNNSIVTATPYCVNVGMIAASGVSSSQLMLFNGNDGSAGHTAGLQLTAGKVLQTGVRFTAVMLGNNYTSTNQVTANQAVKINSANNSVVVCTTSDTICDGFVAETVVDKCTAASTVCPVIEIEGGRALGILDSGTCSIGDYVINGTTTNGRVKCTATQPAFGTQMGIAISSVSTVGNSFDILKTSRPRSSALVASAFTSSASNPASAGAVRLASGDAENFRNNANGADINALKKNSSDVVTVGDTAGVNIANNTNGTPLKGVLSGTATLDFGSLASIGCEDLTITVTGAVSGDSVDLGVPNGSVPSATFWFTAWVSGNDTVTVRGCTLVSGDPASGTFRATVLKF